MANIDYQKYTDKELNQALGSIDAQVYPENYNNLINELNRRRKKIALELSKNQTNSESSTADRLDEKAFSKNYWNVNQAKCDQKKVTRTLGYAALLVFLGVFSLPAYFHSFLLGQQFYSLFTILAWVSAVIIMVASAYHVMHLSEVKITDKQRAWFGIKTKQDEHNFAAIIKCAFVLITALLGYFIAIRTLPVLAHNYFLDNARQSIVVTVADKRKRYRRKHCNGKVYIEEFKHAQVDYVCSVLSRRTWESLQSGDKLRLFGSQSKVGFLVTGARKIQ
ncbi:hypothetical protein [Paraglaciecola aestuariivivens]